MKILIYILLFLTAITATSQSYTLEKVNEVMLDTDVFIGVDTFNALYHIKDDILYKSDVHNGYQFTALQLGKITSVDIVNPLKITVFYGGSNTAVILDNTLSEITRINFSVIEDFRNISHATTANDRRLWIFNTDLQQLELFDWNIEKIIIQFPPMELNAVALTSNFNFAWILNKQGVYKYNNYGSFLDKTPLYNATGLYQSNGDVVALTDGKVNFKPKNSNTFSVLKTPDFTIKQLSLNNEILYLYNGQKLSTFRLKIPKQP